MSLTLRLGAMTLAALLTGAAATGCMERRPAPVPRPYAYPRADLYPAAYRTERFGPLTLQVNDSTVTTTPADDPRWLDIAYPRYNAVVNCTLTPIADTGELDAVTANRRERMELNAGGAYGEVTELRPASGGRAELMMTPGALRTPVQFLATDSQRYVLSGVAVFTAPGSAAPDSLRPAIEAVAADMLHMLKHL